MKVTGTGGAGAAGGPRQTRPSGGGGFSLPAVGPAAGPAPSASVSGPQAVMGVAALLALQDIGGPLERRRQAVRRAGRLLDSLDEIKVALLEGGLDAATLDRLRRALREERLGADEPKLQSVLDEIEVRAAVEMAKLEQRARAA